MVIGNGLMAKAFKNYTKDENIVVFASGVSSSVETNEYQFKREFNLLKETILKFPKAKLIYFSTCSINDATVNQRPYVKHKLKLENYIAKHKPNYLIFRVSNVVGPKGNANTIMNYLVHAVLNNEEILLWKNAERNVIDIDDVKSIVDEVVLSSNIKNETINVAVRESVLVKEILVQIETYLQIKAKVSFVNKGSAMHIDTLNISKALDKIESTKGTGLQYIFNLLKKYY